MPEHVAEVPDRARRLIRTIITVVTSVVTVLLAVVPIVIQALEPVHDTLPGDWYAWLVGIAATIVAVALAVQKILTSDVVEQLLQRYAPRLAAAHPGVIDTTATPVGEIPVVTTLTATEVADARSLRDALDPGDPVRNVLERILERT